MRTMTVLTILVPALGQGAWRMEEDAQRRKEKIAALRRALIWA